ncbi:MAG: hypothetical protein QXS90_00385 [Candidatus Diapherotrites archaeon]
MANFIDFEKKDIVLKSIAENIKYAQENIRWEVGVSFDEIVHNKSMLNNITDIRKESVKIEKNISQEERKEIVKQNIEDINEAVTSAMEIAPYVRISVFVDNYSKRPSYAYYLHKNTKNKEYAIIDDDEDTSCISDDDDDQEDVYYDMHDANQTQKENQNSIIKKISSITKKQPIMNNNTSLNNGTDLHTKVIELKYELRLKEVEIENQKKQIDELTRKLNAVKKKNKEYRDIIIEYEEQMLEYEMEKKEKGTGLSGIVNNLSSNPIVQTLTLGLIANVASKYLPSDVVKEAIQTSITQQDSGGNVHNNEEDNKERKEKKRKSKLYYEEDDHEEDYEQTHQQNTITNKRKVKIENIENTENTENNLSTNVSGNSYVNMNIQENYEEEYEDEYENEEYEESEDGYDADEKAEESRVEQE